MTSDQKRALGVGGVGVGGFLLWRHLHSSSGSSSAVTSAASGPSNSSATGSITPYTPQAPVTLSEGESVYDPNSEDLLNTPTAIPAAPAVATPNVTTPAAPQYVVNVAYPAPVTTKSTAKKPATRKVTKPKPKPKKKVKAKT